MHYENFDLEIRLGQTGEWQVNARAPDGSVARETTPAPYDADELRYQLESIAKGFRATAGGLDTAATAGTEATPTSSLEQVGRVLFDSVFRRQVLALYERSRVDAGKAHRLLRIRLVLGKELNLVPWELLYDTQRNKFLSESPRTPLVRFHQRSDPPLPLAVDGKIRILGVVASPSDRTPLNTDAERSRMREALQELESTGVVELHWLERSTWRSLRETMQQGPWHVLHFVGHGAFDDKKNEGYVELEDEDTGESDPIFASELRKLLEHDPLRLAVLNSCDSARASDVFTSTAAALVDGDVPAVVAMQHSISDKAAIEFSRSFYGAVGRGTPVDSAVAEARTAMNVASPGSVEWATPVLSMHAQDGMLFARTSTHSDTVVSRLWKMLKQIPVAVGGIDVALAVVTAVILPRFIIPVGVRDISRFAAAMVVAGFALTLVHRSKLAEHLRIISWTGLIALLILIAVHVGSVVPRSGERYLVGFHLTDVGHAYADSLGVDPSDRAGIVGAGPDRMPLAWGWSYWLVATVYALAYFAFILCVVLVISGIGLAEAGQRGPPTSKQHPRPSR